MTGEIQPMLTPEDLQALLGGADKISKRTIQRMARALAIPGVVRLGRKLYFQRLPVMQWIEGGGVAGLRRAS